MEFSLVLALDNIRTCPIFSLDSSGNMTRATYDSKRQRARRSTILATTRELLGKLGYDGTTIRAVAEAAGVDKATIYNLYGSKDGLVLAALTGLLDQVVDRATVTQAQPGFERLLAQYEAATDQIEETPDYAEAMARALFRSGRGAPLVEGPLAATLAELEFEQHRGNLPAGVDCGRLARQLDGQRWGIVLVWVLGTMPLEELRLATREGLLATLGTAAPARIIQRLRSAIE